MESNMRIGHLLDNQDCEGAPISIQWDKICGIDWILIKASDGVLIMKVQKYLWDGTTVGSGFTAEVRDKIIEQARRCYG